MAVRNPSEIRNVAVVGHGGCGKTTLVERLLFTAGNTKRMGSVEEGNTVTDWSDEARKYKHSLSMVPVQFEHKGRLINAIDTPGLADFLGQAIASLAAVETALVVVDAARGVESTTRRLMAAAESRAQPRLLVVNKMETADADLEQLVESLRGAFGNVCLPVNLPSAGRKGVVNVFEDGHANEATEFSSVEEAHTRIVEQVVEVDDELMSIYLEKGGEGLDGGRVHAAFLRAMREGHLVPIAFVSAKTGAGAEALLELIEAYCPSPAEGNQSLFLEKGPDGAEKELAAQPEASRPVLAHVFKVTADPFVGKLGIFRVHQGTVRVKGEVYVAGEKKPIRIGHMFKLHGKEHVEVQEAGPGDIAAVSKIDEVHFNSCLVSEQGRAVRLKPFALPKPMFGLAVELKNHADEAKFSGSVAKLMEEDPCFLMERIAATKQTVLRGLGELHLRVMLDRLKTGYGIDVATSPPKVAYKETITARAEGHHRHKKQTGGAGQFGEVYLRVEPLPPDHPEGFEFVSEVVGGTVPRQFWPAVEKGVRQVMADGAVAGYPMTGIKVALTDGKYHDVDSKEIAFVTAGRKAFIDAVSKARPKLLEPYVVLEITVPNAKMGDIAANLSTKRGRVQESQMLGADTCVVKAIAPLGELQTFSNELKSITGGAGTYTMDYSHDEHTPPQVQAAVVAAYKPHPEQE